MNFVLFYSFLYDHQSPAYQLYKEKLQEHLAATSQNFSPPGTDVKTDAQHPGAAPLLNSSSAVHSQESETPPVKRKRKSRWGSEDDKVQLPIPPIVIPPEIIVPDPNAPTLTGKQNCSSV